MRIGNQDINISKEDKLMFPVSGITKGDLVNYYRNVSSLFVKYAKDRPVTLHRFPNGITGTDFMQKNVSTHFPDWIPTISVEKQGGHVEMAMINNEETLSYLTNQGTIVYHIWLSREKNLVNPDRMIIDLDPSDQNFQEVANVAKMIRKIYDDLGLPCFLMTTGSKGLHIVTPLAEKDSFEEVKALAKKLCEHIATLCPKETTVEIRKDKRKGRVFLDYLRNAYAQTGVTPYSVRAIEGAPVAAPLFCEELDDENLHSRYFNINNVIKRIDAKGDPWEGFGNQAFKTKPLNKKLASIIGT